MDPEETYQLLYDEMRWALDHGPSSNYVSAPRFKKSENPYGYSALEIIEDEVAAFSSVLLEDMISIIHEAALGNMEKANKLAIAWEHKLCKNYADWHQE